uniref:PLA2c domain-containing protein n=1 Tax=Salvator merianae TaxID=96440 RepID=A0A8D0E6P7_SALMN
MIRISKALSEGEKTATASRKEEVKKGLERLGIPCDLDQVPNIAVLGAGGAVRAMISLYGTLVELKKFNFLDCVMYLGGVSGSTWCLSTLYKNEDWAENIEALEKQQCEKLAKGQWDFEKAMKALIEAAEDECYSLTDFWSYFLIHGMLNQLDESELSTHRRSCENGKNPYPIYTAVDKETYQKQNAGTWFEFTPHEAGIPGLGAYVDIKHLGSIFENGKLTEEGKEKNLCYLQDALMDFLKQDRTGDSSSSPPNQDEDDKKLSLLFKAYLSVLELQLYKPSDRSGSDKHFDELQNSLKSHISQKTYELLRSIHQSWFSADAETRKKGSLKLCQALDMDLGGFTRHFHSVLHNVLRKTYSCLMNWTWGSTRNFLYHSCEVSFPDLTSKPVVSLIDAGLAINAAYPPLLRPQRQVKLILSFDFSAGDPFLTIRKAAEYCEAHGIPFPEIDERELQDVDNPLDCYIFRGEHAPTIIHCPLFNRVNCTDKIAEYRDQFSTFKMKYSEEDIEKLLTAAKKNVVNIQHKIVEEIKRTVCFPSQAT